MHWRRACKSEKMLHKTLRATPAGVATGCAATPCSPANRIMQPASQALIAKTRMKTGCAWHCLIRGKFYVDCLAGGCYSAVRQQSSAESYSWRKSCNKLQLHELNDRRKCPSRWAVQISSHYQIAAEHPLNTGICAHDRCTDICAGRAQEYLHSGAPAEPVMFRLTTEQLTGRTSTVWPVAMALDAS